ncbi:putative Ig domain-containing protein [Actinokineospora sp. NBRC 105648]|uniref:DUF7927 domain-containing protein n=1 Tax=Actinokineospora sp. NBRC 105648 TaxID=3032206 RepID=UPI0024A2D805|nr:putative Ig domain-containing protein [Actinokineospora sp. NBRC 105648]GLZ39298.1 hypothetical protein Acsp05_29220 [Actinokineospora sp. NBRC 105648]
MRRATALTAAAALVAGVVGAVVGGVSPGTARAAGTTLFDNSFAYNTIAAGGTGTVTVPTPVGGVNAACLTATGNLLTGPVTSCLGTTDANGAGKLRLTSAAVTQAGSVFGATSFPTSNGLDITFNTYQYGGTGADGISFVLAAVDPANPVIPTTIGPNGGSLGYSSSAGTVGLPNGYLGIGLDVYGNFSSPSFQGSGCANPTYISAAVAGAIVVRGPGNGTVGYCGLTTTYAGTTASRVTLRASTRAASVVPVQVLINPTTVAYTSATGVSVAGNSYKVVATPVGGTAKTLTGTLPTVSSTLYPSSSWLTASGVPKQLAFGFAGSTGAVTDVHEIGNVKGLSANPVPQLTVSTTSYSPATATAGGPVTYTVSAGVLAGADEASAVSVTQTLPAGVKPLGAYGSGWTCATPVGQSVTCTTTATSIANGTTLPNITVVGVATTSVTAATVQSGSPSTVSSSDGSPATDTTTTAGTLATTPSGLALSPATGSVSGGGNVTITGSNITNATAIEIGTTAEQQAGTPVTLFPCTATVTTGCFTVSGSTLVINGMPARASVGAVNVTVVTQGVANSVAYTYVDKPATPAAPTATAGVTSATVTWTAPATNGSPITGYVVTPYLNGVAQTPVNYDASATTRTLTGLTAGGNYTFTVAAVNAYGTSAASPLSNTVVPYTVPTAPTITAASAGDAQATLTWTAPTSNGGSAITGYVVTPYINGVAQAPQTFSGTALTQTVTGLTPGTAYTFTVAAQNAAGTGPPSSFSASVTPNRSPSLTFANPASGEVGVAYSTTFTVTDGTAPFTWSIPSGALPPGLTLNTSTGVLSGTPTTAGSYTFTVQVTDASGQTATKSVTIVIAAQPTMTFTPPAGEVGVAYTTQPTVTGGTSPITYAVTAGSLPGGLTLNTSTGVVSGTPTTAGSYTYTLTATDAFNQTAAKTVTVAIAARPTLSTATPPAPQVGVAYSTSFDVTGGTAPYSWALTAGSLPPGLTLNTATGVLSGTPTTTGTYSFSVTVIDAFGQTATKAVTLTVGAGPIVITKTANTSSAAVGSTVAYTITVANTGSTAFTGVTLSDPLGGVLDDATYSGNATATSGTLTYSSSTLGWTGNVAAGATVVISYSVAVSNPGTGNKILANTVSSSTLGTNCPSGGADTRCTATVTVPGLNIVKSADVSSTTPGGTVRYTITATNTGQTAFAAATFTDGLAGVLDDASYNGDGTTTSGSVSFTSPNLTWTGPLAIGASTTVSYSVTVNNPDTGDKALTGTVTSPTAGSSCPSAAPAAQCTSTVTVLVPALSITNTANTTSTTPGGTVSYTVTLANTGQTAYTGTSVAIGLSGALDDAIYGGGASATSGSLAYSAPTLTWTGNIPIGGTVTITYALTARSPAPGDKTITTVVSSGAAGSACPAGSANSACTSNVQVLIPGLTITKAADSATTTPGATVRYTIAVTNSGQTPYTGAALSDQLTGVLDDATYNGDAAATSGSVSYSAPTLSWTGNLAVGATATITYSVAVKSPATGDKTMTNTATSTAAGSTCPTGSPGAQCTSTVAVLIPALTFAVTPDATTTTPGSTVKHTVSVTNSGQTTYTNLAVTVDLNGATDDATYDNDAAVSTGSLVNNGDGTATWTLSLAPGAAANLTLTTTVNNPDTGDKVLRVAAYSTAAGSPCAAGSTSSSCRDTVTVLVPGLTITKSANASAVTPGDPVTYTVSVVNSGQTTYSPAAFTDDLTTVLTDAVYTGNATATTGAVSYSAPVLSWSGTLAPGATATITYAVAVRDPDPGDKRLINTIVSSAPGNNCPAGGTDARCTATVSVLVPALTITSTAGSATTVPGATLSKTITVTNSGATPYTDAAFTDALAGTLDDADYNGDAAASTGTVSYAGGVLSWSGNLAVGASATITYTVAVHPADGGDNLVKDTVTSSTRGVNCTSGNTDSRCGSTVPVARLVLQQSYQDTSTTPGAVVRLNATFTNTGKVAYTGITVSSPSADTLDDAIANGDQAATSGTLSLGASAISWTGDIPVGGTVSVTGTLTVKNPDTGNKLLTGTMNSTAPGNNCPTGTTDTRCTAALPVLVPGLTLTKAANTTTAVPDGTVSYTVTVTNSGQTAQTGAAFTDSLSAVLDDATYNNNGAATTGTVSFASETLSWSGSLAVGAVATITYSVTVNTNGTGDKTLTNSVSSTNAGSTCPPASGNTACTSTVAVLTPALTLVKTADLPNATLGSTVTYTIRATNTGQTAYASAAFTDPLAAVLDDAVYNNNATATAGTVSYASGVLSWSGPLALGAAATITYTVTIRNPDPGNQSMTNTVVSTTQGANCASGSTDGRCTATVAVTNATSLTLTKTADVTATTAGQRVTYTVKVVNASILPVLSADFSDPLADIVDDATYNNDAVVSAGTITYSGTTLSWAGSVGALSTVTATYSVTTKAVPTGNQILTGRVVSTALLSSNNCLSTSTDPRCVSTIPVASLRIQQAYTETSTTPGSTVHLTATFTNTGQYAYNGISITSPTADTLDDAIPGEQSVSSGTLVLSATAITWTGDIPVGATITLTGELTAKDPPTGNRLLTGTLQSTALGNNCPTGTMDTRCTATVPVLIPGLTITKSADTTFVVPGGTAGFTITIRNSGQTPYTGASVTDVLSGLLDDAVYNNNAVATSGAVVYTSPNLVWTGNLAVGATATVTYSATARNPATGDKTMVNPVFSTTVGSTCPPASGDAACRTTVAVLTPALTITSSAGTSSAIPGQTVAYSVTATNTGQTAYGAATFSVPLADVLDDATYPGGATASSGTVTVTGQTLTWTGPLATGAAATITYPVVVNNPDTGNHRLTQTVVSTSQGSTCPTGGTDPRCTTSVPVAGLTITNVASTATTKPTSVVSYTVTLANSGQTPYTGITVDAAFAGALDDADYNGDAATSSGSLLLIAETGTVRWTGDLPVGGSVVITGSVTVKYPEPGDKVLSTVVTTAAAGSNCPTGGADTRCRTSVTVLTPALTITKSADTTTTTPGGTVGYTITISNTGQTPYAGARVSDSLRGVLTDATYLGDASATSGTVAYTNPTLTWTGDLALAQVVVVAYHVRVNTPDLGDKRMVNGVASDELGSTCPTGDARAGCSTEVTVLVPALDITVTADRTTTVPGGSVDYTVTIANTGQTPYVGANVVVQLAGVLDDAAYDGDGTATTGGLAFTAPNLTWTGDLAVGATAVVSYGVTVARPDTGDLRLVTTAYSTAPGSSCGAGCQNTVVVLIPGLSVSTTANVSTATPGDEVVFTITLVNTGQTAYTNTTVSTSLANVVDDALFDGTVTASTGVATYTAPALSWTGSLAVGATAVITYAVTVRSPDPGDKLLTSTVVAPAQGSTCPAVGGAPACTVSVTVLVPALTISKTASSPTATPGSTVGYRIVVTNTGQTAYPAAVVSDSLRDVLTDADYDGDAAVVGGGTLSYADSTITWTGALPIGAAATITYSVTVRDPDPGDKWLMNEVSSPSPGSSCPPDGSAPGCSTTVQVLVPALAITKTADTATAVAGGSVRYTVTLTNTGETDYTPATFVDSLAAVLDDADYAGDATASTGDVAYTAGTITWSGGLAVDEVATVSYSVRTRYPATGDKTLSNRVSSPSAGASCRTGAEAGCSTAVALLVPGLAISKAANTAQVVAGGSVQYTITATNTGEADYPSVTITDPLAGVLDDAVYSDNATATSGTVGYAGGTVTWTGPVARGATVLITFTVAVNAGTTGDEVLRNRVESAAVGSTCPVGGSAPACSTTTPVAPRFITLTDLTPEFTLTGLPGVAVDSTGIVTMTVTTNSTSGYTVTVRPLSPTLVGSTTTIPVERLSVRETGGGAFQPLAPGAARVVHRQDTPSAPSGDAVSNDYRVEIPDVPSDTYAATLEYVAGTQ